MSERARPRALEFGAFRLDRKAERLERDGTAIPLRPKTWEVLCHLAARPGALVSKRELHDAVWRGVAVTEDTLTQSILELRRAFGDDPRKPRFIETVHARGFRFIAAPRAAGGAAAGGARGRGGGAPFVGRDGELARLRALLRRAAGGRRQVVFITGEAGIGKTRLVEEFLSSPALQRMGTLVLSGQCIERHAGREAHAPVLDALERALASPEGRTLRPVWERLAPTWVAQIPMLTGDGAPPHSGASDASGMPARMIREGVAALETVAAERPLVLVLEDLHWSDPATVDLVSALGERGNPARLVLIATYRPAEASVAEHPIRLVRHTLRVHDHSVDLALDYLSESSVREYLRRRFGDGARKLASLIHDHTDGNPLFVVQVADELVRRGAIARHRKGWVVSPSIARRDLALSDDLREMIRLELRHLTANEREIVEVGAVAGIAFAPDIVATALARDPEEVGASCDRLAGSRLLLDATERAQWPGGPLIPQYQFIHALHHDVVYGQVSPVRRRRLHARLGNALEAIVGPHAPEIAPDLARHFEQAGDRRRAVTYLVASAMRALRRFAGTEGARCLDEALTLLAKEPRDDDRRRRELEVRSLLSLALSTTRGYLSSEVVANYERVLALQRDMRDLRSVFETTHALFLVVFHRADRDATERVLTKLERLAAEVGAIDLQPRVTLARAVVELFTGRLVAAEDAFTRLAALELDPSVRDFGSVYGVDPVTFGLVHRGVGDWLRGYPDRARAWTREGVARAERGESPLALAGALCHGAYLAGLCGDGDEAADLSQRAMEIATERDIAFYQPIAAFARGVALAEQGRLDEALRSIEAGIDGRQATGSRISGSLLVASLADVHVRVERWDEGLARVDDALATADTFLDGSHVAELWRLRGELLLGKRSRERRRSGATTRSAENCFRRSLEIAEGQGARMLALRAATSLLRLHAAQGRDLAARATLARLYATFDEGFETKDLLEARRLLGRPEAERTLAS
jgi:DNA-binding winged helix-turn-helix (wHTH) protein/tetratricopeptide (TPR) repeat protein